MSKEIEKSIDAAVENYPYGQQVKDEFEKEEKEGFRCSRKFGIGAAINSTEDKKENMVFVNIMIYIAHVISYEEADADYV